MEDLIEHVMTLRGGYAFRSDLLEAGLDDRRIAGSLRSGHLTRIRHGTYVVTSSFRALSPEQQHLVAAFSVVDKLGPSVALSHHSAAMAHTGTSWGIDLRTVHVTRLDGRGCRREAGVVHHVGHVVGDDEIALVDGRQVVRPARAVIESCSLASVESAMVTASFALRVGVCTQDELAERLHLHERWPGMLTVRLGLGAAEPRCESVGEVRSLFMFGVTGVPRPDVQVEIRLADMGLVIARSDYGWWPARHLGEFDGLFKYGRLNPYADPGESIVREKKREDQIRDQLWGMSRWIWRDLEPENRGATGRRILQAIERSRRLYTRNGTHIPLL